MNYVPGIVVKGGEAIYPEVVDTLLSAPDFRVWLRRWIEMLRPTQSVMICDEVGNLLVDFVGHFETLDNDFATVCDRIGLPPQSLAVVNQSKKHVPWRKMYDTETFDLVRRAFSRDIELFGYAEVTPEPDAPVRATP
jgi:hypothetical protein